MAELAVARTYGSALYQAAKELGKIELIREELAALQAVFERDPELMLFLSAPSIPGTEKQTVIHDLFDGDLCEEIVNFLLILVEKGRIKRFSKIIAVYERLQDEEEGVILGSIYSAVPLSEDRLAKFEAETGKLLQKKVRLENEIDKSLIGGVRIFADGKMIDASVRARVSALIETIK